MLHRFIAISLAVALPGAVLAADPFPRPAGLEPDVGFWLYIYTEVSSDSGVIHDARDLRVSYETVRLAPGASTRARSRQIEKRKQHYRIILKKLATGKRDGLSREEQRVLGLFPKDVSGETLTRAGRRMRFQLGQSDRFRAGLVRSGAYKRFIVAALNERALPSELAALPHVESSYEPRAYSKVGAAGMWQFTRSTGRRYMRVDHVVDERRDPYLSSLAAVRLLESNYAATDSWPLALTGYNHGVSGMRRAARRLGTSDIEQIVRRYRSPTFGFASRNFYVAFLAALEVDRQPRKYFDNLVLEKPVAHTLVEAPDYIDAVGLAAALGIDVGALKRANPALQDPVWNGLKHIPKGFTLRLPPSTGQSNPPAVVAGLDATLRFAAQLPDRSHKVRPGETLSGIAARYGLRVSDVMAMNSLGSRHRIRAGQTLNLPARGAVGRPPVSAEPATAAVAVNTNAAQSSDESAAGESDSGPEQSAAIVSAEVDASLPTVNSEDTGSDLATAQPVLAADPSDYSVAADGSIEIQAVETLGHYADWLELRTQRLRELNGYGFNRPVVVGRRLKLDFSHVSRARFEARRVAYHRDLQENFFARFRISDSRLHKIRRGESLWVLAHRTYDVPVWLLRQYNPDLSLDRVYPGLMVKFPVLVPNDTSASAPQVAPARFGHGSLPPNRYRLAVTIGRAISPSRPIPGLNRV